MTSLFLLLIVIMSAEANCAGGYENDNSESFFNGANDVIVVKQSDGTYKATPIQVQVRGLLRHFHIQNATLVSWKKIIKMHICNRSAQIV